MTINVLLTSFLWKDNKCGNQVCTNIGVSKIQSNKQKNKFPPRQDVPSFLNFKVHYVYLLLNVHTEH